MDLVAYWQQHCAPFIRARFGRSERGARVSADHSRTRIYTTDRRGPVIVGVCPCPCDPGACVAETNGIFPGWRHLRHYGLSEQFHSPRDPGSCSRRPYFLHLCLAKRSHPQAGLAERRGYLVLASRCASDRVRRDVRDRFPAATCCHAV